MKELRMRSIAVLCLFIVPSISSKGLSQECRNLLSCAVRKDCIKVSWLKTKYTNQVISAQLYDDVASAIDYGCIFNTGCNEECNACNLCMNSKLQLTDVLSGETNVGECQSLVACATACIAKAGAESQKIVDCLLHGCAFHCFNGSCNKCSQFTTRVFNQACVSANLRTSLKNFHGQCHEMFRSIVYHKFRQQFDGLGRLPSIGKVVTH